MKTALLFSLLIFPFIAVPQPVAAAGGEKSSHTVTGNVTLASQYVFRGLTQTNGKPAVQGGLDYGHSSGFYLGTWLSNVSWVGDQNAGTVSAPAPLSSPGPAGTPYAPNKSNSNSLEWDHYGGYKRRLGENWNYDLGVIHYAYPGTYDNVGAYRRPDTTELYGAVGYKWLTLKYSHGVSRYTFGANESSGGNYIDLSATVPVLNGGTNLLLHVGRQTFSNHPNFGYFGNSGGDNTFYSYTDYKIGLTKDWEQFTFGVAWTRANTRATAPDGQTTAYMNAFGKNVGGDRLALTVTRTF